MFTDVTHLEKMIRLFAYKQTYDTGFAPNPFHGVCTLATCKRYIRKHKQVGDWIAGFTSNGLNGDKVGQERLIFLMQVEEEVPFERISWTRGLLRRSPCGARYSAAKSARTPSAAIIRTPRRAAIGALHRDGR